MTGIIPAGAGKSASAGRCWARGRDHPRGCGEKRRDAQNGHGHGGSSPRVRGKEITLAGEDKPRGIIPAGAGKRNMVRNRTMESEDHPRGCGEKPPSSSAKSATLGSSPRVRGKAAYDWRTALRLGIIPAGAGKRRRSRSRVVWRRDHPRGCGEKPRAGEPHCGRRGSSPRVRGKVVALGDGLRLQRIIPAGAGKRATTRPRQARAGDHPRGCGEKRPSASPRTKTSGSSPRVRGKV